MKKYFLIAAAAVLAMSACAKIESGNSQKEVTFQVANYIQTKASGAVYANGAFGTYAWFNSTDDFMVNEQVNLASGVWKTIDHTFYWPKTGSIDFISYSPFAGTSDTPGTVPAVTKNTITYTNVTAGTDDLMYADKATCSSNVNEITDDAITGTDSGFEGVPTLFHHALAKVSFKVKANFLTYTDATNSTTTTWEVTVNSAKISGFYTTGSCALTLNADGKTWDKPAGDLWTSLSGATAAQELITTPVVLTTAAQDIAPAAGFVIPQTLQAATQQLELDVHIKTTLSNGKIIEEDYTPTLDIKDISSITEWKMNQNIVYTINFKPTATISTNPGDFDNPEDATITFDPAVADWDNVAASATIQI